MLFCNLRAKVIKMNSGVKQFLIDPTGEVFRIKTLAGNLWSKIEQKAADLLAWGS